MATGLRRDTGTAAYALFVSPHGERNRDGPFPDLGRSLGAPFLNVRGKEGVWNHLLVDDDQIRHSMRLLFRAAKLVVEPAGATALAALMYPLRRRLDGKSVGIVVCGGNTDAATFAAHVLP